MILILSTVTITTGPKPTRLSNTFLSPALSTIGQDIQKSRRNSRTYKRTIGFACLRIRIILSRESTHHPFKIHYRFQSTNALTPAYIPPLSVLVQVRHRYLSSFKIGRRKFSLQYILQTPF